MTQQVNTLVDLERYIPRGLSMEECWHWLGPVEPVGYGVFGMANKVLKAHRLVYETRFGEIPKGMYVCHRCDVRDCVNPAHLFLGTHADNMHDMATKGRRKGICQGDDHGIAKLKESQIPTIRALYSEGKTYQQIADLYSVSRATIWRVVTGVYWRHVQ